MSKATQWKRSKYEDGEQNSRPVEQIDEKESCNVEYTTSLRRSGRARPTNRTVVNIRVRVCSLIKNVSKSQFPYQLSDGFI